MDSSFQRLREWAAKQVISIWTRIRGEEPEPHGPEQTALISPASPPSVTQQTTNQSSPETLAADSTYNPPNDASQQTAQPWTDDKDAPFSYPVALAQAKRTLKQRQQNGLSLHHATMTEQNPMADPIASSEETQPVLNTAAPLEPRESLSSDTTKEDSAKAEPVTPDTTDEPNQAVVPENADIDSIKDVSEDNNSVEPEISIPEKAGIDEDVDVQEVIDTAETFPEPDNSASLPEDANLVVEIPPELPLQRADSVDLDADQTVLLTQQVQVGEQHLSLPAVLESLLFVAETAIEPTQCAKVLGISKDEVEATLQAMTQEYKTNHRGLRLQLRNGKYQLVTMPASAAIIEEFLSLDLTTKLSGPALEVLAVVAYRQPVTRVQIEAVRGVDCSSMLRSLVQRGMVEEVGRLEAPGRPILYGVTDQFMHHFGLMELGELPPLESSEADTLWAATTLAELEEAKKQTEEDATS